MKNPVQSRNVSLAICVAGASAFAFALFKMSDETVIRGGLVATGMIAALWGGAFGIMRHFDVRTRNAILRGEGIVARWTIDADTWNAFRTMSATLDSRAGAMPNDLNVSASLQSPFINVVVANNAILVGNDQFSIPLRGSPRVVNATIGRGPPRYLDLELMHAYNSYVDVGPSSGAVSIKTLRVPFPIAAAHDAETARAHYAQSVVESRPRPGYAINAPGLARVSRTRLLVVIAAALMMFVIGYSLRNTRPGLALWLTAIGASIAATACALLLVVQVRRSNDR